MQNAECRMENGECLIINYEFSLKTIFLTTKGTKKPQRTQ